MNFQKFEQINWILFVILRSVINISRFAYITKLKIVDVIFQMFSSYSQKKEEDISFFL